MNFGIINIDKNENENEKNNFNIYNLKIYIILKNFVEKEIEKKKIQNF